MIKLFWSMILCGAVLLAYPHFTKKPVFHESFRPAAIDALEYPQTVLLVKLAPNQDGKNLQAYGSNAKVVREYSVPAGWELGFKPILLKATNRTHGEPPADRKNVPDYVIRYIGRSETVDIIVDVQTGSLWFQERGSFRPFFSKVVGSQRQEIIDQLRAAMPQSLSKPVR